MEASDAALNAVVACQAQFRFLLTTIEKIRKSGGGIIGLFKVIHCAGFGAQ